MCYKGKCLRCIPVEHGCLALAILSAIGSGLGFLTCVISVVLVLTGVDIFTNNPDHIFVGIFFGFFVPIIAVAFLVAFIFSFLLCDGICKLRPHHVKAYFIYGVVMTVLAVLSAVGYLISYSREPEPGVITLFACVIYSLFLVLVYQTYTKLQERAMFKENILVES